MTRASIAAVLVLAGCQGVPKAEIAWQALHAVDVAQTVQIARSSCYQESDELTARIIGEDPSTGEALAWGVGLAGVHYGVTRWLESIEAPRWVQGTWQALTIGNTAYFIKQNNDQGIKPWDTDC